MELFRREALDGQDRLHGEVVFIPQVSWRMLLAFFLAALAVAALFLVTARYRPVTTVSGRLVAHEGSLLALLEVPAAAAATIVPGQTLRLSAPGRSRTLDAQVSTLGPPRDGTRIVAATLDADVAGTPPPRAGMTVRTPLPARSRTLAAWLYDEVAGRARE